MTNATDTTLSSLEASLRNAESFSATYRKVDAYDNATEETVNCLRGEFQLALIVKNGNTSIAVPLSDVVAISALMGDFTCEEWRRDVSGFFLESSYDPYDYMYEDESDLEEDDCP